jgi:signal transduction histidine kinase
MFYDQPSIFSFRQAPSLALAVPLFHQRRLIGVVGLYSDLKALRASWSETRWIIIIYLILDSAVAILFGTYVLSRRLVKPLKRLIGRVEALAEGRYEPAAASAAGAGEIDRLEQSFEAMAVTLLENRLELEKNLASLEAAQEGLIRSEKLATIGRMAAGLAHELGNPLGSLLGFVHLLQRSDPTDEERIDYLKRMEGEISRMDGILRTLLDFARPAPAAEAGLVDVNNLVEDAVALASVQKWFQGLELTTELSPGLPAVGGEQNRLTQVLLNLLANAGQAMNGRGRLIVSTGRRGDRVFVAVADTGPGLDPGDVKHVFEPFFTRKEPGQGTGLGLSVSLSIVESMGGHIEVDNQPGTGCVFTVFLPVFEGTAGRS